MKRLALFLLVSCSQTAPEGSVCKVTSDCKAGLFCVDAVCKANIGSGVACTSATDCKAQEACVSGKCGQLGCDASHECNNGCCDGGQCVAADSCTGDSKCGADGTCPTRCDAASKGNGCNTGCCDTSSGVCDDGTANAACGNSGAACVACDNGSSCSSQKCTCTACGGSTVCFNGSCVGCGSAPCGGDTPYCDVASHACQPCTNAPQNFCAGATPSCNQNGACGATCDATSICPNGLACDLASGKCKTSCTPDTSTGCAASGNFCANDGSGCSPLLAVGEACTGDGDCTSARCDCSAPDCSTRVCTTGCLICTYAESDSGMCAGGKIYASMPAFNCNATTGSCSDGVCACDGAGGCGNAAGQACSIDNDCASGVCACTDAACTAALRVCAATNCGTCNYIDSSSGSCGTGTTDAVTVGLTSLDCSTTAGCASPPCACDGKGICGLADGDNCSSSASCASGHCNTTSASGGADGICGNVPCACGYVNDTQTSCAGPIPVYDPSPDCKGGGACDGSYHCKGLSDSACSNNSNCLPNWPGCDCVDYPCTRRTCQALDCENSCEFLNPGQGGPGDCGLTCCPTQAGGSCGNIPGQHCDGAGNCVIPVIGF